MQPIYRINGSLYNKELKIIEHRHNYHCHTWIRQFCLDFTIPSSNPWSTHIPSPMRRYSTILLSILHGDICRIRSFQSILQWQTLVESFSNPTTSIHTSALRTLSSLEHPCTAERNFISADCKTLKSSCYGTHKITVKQCGQSHKVKNMICISLWAFFFNILEIMPQTLWNLFILILMTSSLL